MPNALETLRERGYIHDVSDEVGLREALERPISFYIGFDPSAESFHIGNLLGIMAMAQMQAGMAVYAKSMGAKELPAEVNPDNVAFMEQNKEQLEAMQAKLDEVPDPCEDAGDPYDDEGEDTDYDEE